MDWRTRGKTSRDYGPEGIWQKGLEFMKQSENQWPVHNITKEVLLPDSIRKANVNTATNIRDRSLAARIDINKYSSYTKLTRIISRVLAMYKRKPKLTFSNAVRSLTSEDINKAETFWIKEAQKLITADAIKRNYKRLSPKFRNDGIIIVGG